MNITYIVLIHYYTVLQPKITMYIYYNKSYRYCQQKSNGINLIKTITFKHTTRNLMYATHNCF